MGWVNKVWRWPTIRDSRPHYTDVFTASIPTLSYFERENGRYEQLLAAQLSQPGSIVSVHGPSKCGKTSLVLRVLKGRAHLVVGCGIDESEDSLWARVAEELGIHSSISVSVEATGKAHIGSELIGAKVTTGAQQSESKSRNVNVREAALKKLASRSTILVFDDVHFLEPATVRALLSTLKRYALSANVVLISTFSGQDLSAQYQVNLDARGKKLALKAWEASEIAVHLRRCFELLCTNATDAMILSMAQRSYGNPLIANNCGFYYCFRKETDVGFDYEEPYFFKSAIEDGFLTGNRELFNKLVVGTNRQVTDRNIYKFRGGFKGDIYFGIMLALKEFGALDEIGKRTLFEKVRGLVVGYERGTGLQERQVTQALGVLSRTARAIAQEQTDDANRDIPLEWDETQSMLYIGDPGLKLYVAYADWEKEQQARYLTLL